MQPFLVDDRDALVITAQSGGILASSVRLIKVIGILPGQ